MGPRRTNGGEGLYRHLHGKFQVLLRRGSMLAWSLRQLENCETQLGLLRLISSRPQTWVKVCQDCNRPCELHRERQRQMPHTVWQRHGMGSRLHAYKKRRHRGAGAPVEPISWVWLAWWCYALPIPVASARMTFSPLRCVPKVHEGCHR